MGVFNVLKTKAPCSYCNREAPFYVQFRYGDPWSPAYKIGGHIQWGTNNNGVQGAKKVILSGIERVCPHCKGDYPEFQILLVDNVLTKVLENEEKFPMPEEEEYLILGEP